MKKNSFRQSVKFPSKRSLQRAIQRHLRDPRQPRHTIPTVVSWEYIPHRKNEAFRLSIVRRAEAVLRSWGR